MLTEAGTAAFNSATGVDTDLAVGEDGFAPFCTAAATTQYFMLADVGDRLPMVWKISPPN